MPLPSDAVPRLSPHYVFRWEESQGAYILLYPEGLIKLNGSAGEILKRCDGQRNIAAIVHDLQSVFSGDGAAIDSSTLAFLDMAQDKGWLRLA